MFEEMNIKIWVDLCASWNNFWAKVREIIFQVLGIKADWVLTKFWLGRSDILQRERKLSIFGHSLCNCPWMCKKKIVTKQVMYEFD